MGLAQRIREFVDGPEEEDWDDMEETVQEMPSAQAVVAPMFQKSRFELVMASPRQFDEAVKIVGHICRGRLVTVNLEGVPSPLSRRMVDFLSGAAYARQARVERVAAYTYVILPCQVGFDSAVPEF